MPPVAKKRKAAKKKENPTPFSASTQTHGDGDDVKHQDDKDSGVGEVNSPASEDLHSHHNSFSGGEDEIEGDNISNLPSVGGERIRIIDEPREMVMEERFFPIKNNPDKKDGKIEHDEIGSKSCDEGSSGSPSSNSSSDDESREINISKDESTPAVVPVDISLSREKAEVGISSQANNSVAPSMEESELTKENGEKKQSAVEDKVGISEEDTIISYVENIIGISDRTECIAQETDDHLSVSGNLRIASGDNEGDREKDSGISEPLLAPASHLEQTTSWKSCCGLFEVFWGSAR